MRFTFFIFNFFPSRTVALELFGWEIHWYGVLYIVAFLLCLYGAPLLARYRQLHLSDTAWFEIIAWGGVGAVVGGRLGYALFYEPAYFFAHGADIFKLWQGGMSSHGGFIGVVITLWFISRRYAVSLFALTDILVVPVAVALAIGRIGNLINQEIASTVGSVPWPVYAALKDALLAAGGYICLRFFKRVPNGVITGLFLFLYGVVRFFLEYIRFQDFPLLQIGGIALSRGQLLTVPLIVLGLWVVRRKSM